MDDLWACPSCHSLNVRSARRCYKCKEKRPANVTADAAAATAAPGVSAPASPAPATQPAQPTAPAPATPTKEPAPKRRVIGKSARSVAEASAPVAAAAATDAAPDTAAEPETAAPLEPAPATGAVEATDEAAEVDAAARLASVVGAAPDVPAAPPEPAAPKPEPAAPKPAKVLPPVDCVSCGNPIFTTDKYCARCGHRVGTPIAGAPAAAEPDVVPAVAASTVVTRPVGSRYMATPMSPSARSARLPFKPVAAVLTGLALFAFGVFIGVEVLTPEPTTSGRTSDVTAASPSPSVIVHTLTMNVAIDESKGSDVDAFGTIAMGEPCQPSAGAFPDIREGTPVLVADQAGKILAKATLAEGRKSGVSTCAFAAHASVPEATFYRIGIADRAANVVSIEELSHAAWTADLRFVATP